MPFWIVVLLGILALTYLETNLRLMRQTASASWKEALFIFFFGTLSLLLVGVVGWLCSGKRPSTPPKLTPLSIDWKPQSAEDVEKALKRLRPSRPPK